MFLCDFIEEKSNSLQSKKKKKKKKKKAHQRDFEHLLQFVMIQS
jgi:hypothetical protein